MLKWGDEWGLYKGADRILSLCVAWRKCMYECEGEPEETRKSHGMRVAVVAQELYVEGMYDAFA